MELVLDYTAIKMRFDLLLSKRSLTVSETETVMDSLLTHSDSHQIAAFLAVLKNRGETVEEIIGMKNALLKRSIPVVLPYPVIDIVGTGGDLANMVNISTGSSFLAAACGIPVAKHGNRSVSSRSGSADVLEAMGVNIEIAPDKVAECLEHANITFMFAPYYNSSLKLLRAARNGLKFPTVINLMGPLLNPSKAAYSLIGVASLDALELISQVVMGDKSKKRTLVFHGCGLDELTPLGPIVAYEVFDGKRIRHDLDPQALGFAPCSLKDLQGGDATENAGLLLDVFAGKQNAVADSLIFNAGAALWIFGISSTLKEGIAKARGVHREGLAMQTLIKLQQFSPLKYPLNGLPASTEHK